MFCNVYASSQFNHTEEAHFLNLLGTLLLALLIHSPWEFRLISSACWTEGVLKWLPVVPLEEVGKAQLFK